MPEPRYAKSLFIFRRDLRVDDNTALVQALRQSAKVLPCFILDPRQIEPHPYQSRPALVFMRQSLLELDRALQVLGANLAVYQGLPADVINQLIGKFSIQAVYVNRDYSPFSRQRDYDLAQLCGEKGVDFYSCPDVLLTEPENLLKADKKPYQVFTAYYHCARQQIVPLPLVNRQMNFLRDQDADISQASFPVETKQAGVISGGRMAGLAILNQLAKQAEYDLSRDFPALDATTKLSAHLKFGTVSVREAYYAVKSNLGPEHPLLRQLYWRDFFTHIAFHFPYVFGKAFHSQYDKLQWDNNREYFKRWCEGVTGFPIVDAGMRELNATGFMHNRVRMITASFLVKDLHISWRWGERYFARQLVDYDPAVNNGNWQWAASTGCDAQPYFRIFNPWLQQKKFDQDCIYIRRWLPELKPAPASVIHHWYEQHTPDFAYPVPMVEHAAESKLAKERFWQAASRK